jgi:hypothetical protein
MKFAVILFTISLSLTATVFGQKSLDKPFQEWSREEAQQLLSDSPWVRSYQSVEGLAAIEKAAMLKDQDSSNAARVGPRATDARAQAQPLAVPIVMARLHSGMVVREALVRLREIAANYDKMNGEKRAAFDSTVKDILDCGYCKNYYIVTMSKSLNSSRQSVEDGLFQTLTNQQMKGMVWLVNDSGVRSPLIQFIPPKGAADEAIFFFPRRDTGGKELISPENKTFKIEFSGEFLTSKNPYYQIIPRSFDFEVDKITRENKVLF